MPSKEEIQVAQGTMKARRQIEEIVGSPVGTVKTYSAPTDEEYESAYAEMCEKRTKLLHRLKKFRPISMLAGLLVILGAIVFLVLSTLKDLDFTFLVVIIIFLGICILVGFSPKTWAPPSKEKYFDEITVENAKKWLNEAKGNNYYFDLIEKALAEKDAHAIFIKGACWLLSVGESEFTVFRFVERVGMECLTFQIENVSGITLQKQVRVLKRSTSYNTDSKFYTNTEMTQSAEYLVSFSFNNRLNSYSLYVGTNCNLLLAVVNLFEQRTGLQAKTL